MFFSLKKALTHNDSSEIWPQWILYLYSRKPMISPSPENDCPYHGNAWRDRCGRLPQVSPRINGIRKYARGPQTGILARDLLHVPDFQSRDRFAFISRTRMEKDWGETRKELMEALGYLIHSFPCHHLHSP